MLRVNIAYFFVILLIFLVSLFGPLVMQLLNTDGSFFARERVAQQFLLLDETIWLPLVAHLCVSRATLHPGVAPDRRAALQGCARCWNAIGDGDLVGRAVLRKNDYLREGRVGH